MSDDRRHHLRYAVTQGASVKTDKGEVKATVDNISGGGASVNLDVEIEIGSQVSINIEGVGKFDGKVVRKSGSTGIKFDIEEDEAEELASEIMDRMKGAFPV